MKYANNRGSLIEAELKAKNLFNTILKRKLIQPGLSESDLSLLIHKLAFEMYGIKEYWHKRIVRFGSNTLLPYNENPENLRLKLDDILFLDFGPIFNNWEADLGRTFVLGTDPIKLKLSRDVEKSWKMAKSYFDSNLTLTASSLYHYVVNLAKKKSWEFGNEHCGHLIGHFPHAKISGEKIKSYIHPDNHTQLRDKDENGFYRDWILEIHFVNYKLKIGGFYEQLLTI